MKLLDGDPAGAAAGSEDDFCATLLAMAGHDLCQPLQVITSAHDALAPTLESDSQRYALERAEDARARLATMLRQIVEALQLREAPRNCRNQTVSLGPIFDDLVAGFAVPARSKEISFAVVPPPVKVLSEPTLLLAILRNLVRNAIDYTPRGGRVLVACHRIGSEVRIEVQDSGAGIHPADVTQIFAAFHRSDNTRPDGLGLGLFIAKRAAQFLDHRIYIRSALGRGSCFGVVAKAGDLSRRQAPRPSSASVIASQA